MCICTLYLKLCVYTYICTNIYTQVYIYAYLEVSSPNRICHYPKSAFNTHVKDSLLHIILNLIPYLNFEQGRILGRSQDTWDPPISAVKPSKDFLKRNFLFLGLTFLIFKRKRQDKTIPFKSRILEFSKSLPTIGNIFQWCANMK